MKFDFELSQIIRARQDDFLLLNQKRVGKMNREIIQTDHAPAPVGPYSQAVRVGNMLFCSGQIPLDPKTGELIQIQFRIKLSL
ncbi:MAG: Rid family hydrolase [Bdellovibrionales bacterium]